MGEFHCTLEPKENMDTIEMLQLLDKNRDATFALQTTDGEEVNNLKLLSLHNFWEIGRPHKLTMWFKTADGTRAFLGEYVQELRIQM